MPFDRVGNNLREARKISLKSQTRSIKGWIGGSDQSDLFKFRLNKSSDATFKLSKLKSDANLELINKRGNIVATSVRPSRKNERITIENLESGKYYLRVYRNRGNTKYKLQFKMTPSSKSGSKDSQSLTTLHPFIQRVLDITNGYRSQAGLSPLTLNNRLNRAAQGHSESMALDDFFSHTGIDGSSPFDRIESEGYQFRTAAENIAAGYSTPESVVAAWMNSPGHRANILDGSLHEIGIGYYFLANDPGTLTYNSYWTQAFGTPFR